MVRGTVAVADVELACVSDGARQVLLGAAAGRGHVDRLRQEGRDGGRKRAARAVRVLRRYAGSREGNRDDVVEEQVVGGLALKMAALEIDPGVSTPEELPELAGDFGELLLRHVLFSSEKAHGFGQVGRDDGGERQEPLLQGVDGVSRKQPAAALGDHDGVEHHEAGLAAHERVGHRLDLLDRAEHADLDRVDANVVKERVDLLLEEGRGHGHDARDGLRVLSGQGRDDAAGIGAAGAHGLDVGENARTARGVHPRDAYDVRDAVFCAFCHKTSNIVIIR